MASELHERSSITRYDKVATVLLGCLACLFSGVALLGFVWLFPVEAMTPREKLDMLLRVFVQHLSTLN
jgi:hypothetical protein